MMRFGTFTVVAVACAGSATSEHLQSSDVGSSRLRGSLAHITLDAGGGGAARAGVLRLADPGGSVTTTTSKSWLDRMKDAMTSFVVGIVLIIFSIPVLWVNERRNARMQSLIARSRTDVRSASSKKANEDARGTLVHVSDGSTLAAAPVSSNLFSDVSLKSGCVKLRACVEVYQWVEKADKQEKKNNVGGGTTTTTTYSYSKKWVMHREDSSKFKENDKHTNTSPDGLQIGAEVVKCASVHYGDVFLVPDGLVDQMSNYRNAEGLLGPQVHANKIAFSKHSDNWYYHPKPRDAEIGDARAKFEYVPEGPATIVALQTLVAEDKSRDSFKPYRLFSRGLCGMREDDEKRAALRQADKSSADLVAEDSWTMGPLACLCCACNLVTACFTSLATPQIFHIFEGTKSEGECFAAIVTENTMMTWIMRLVGWVMMLAGTYGLFKPLLTFVDIIPFLGPLVSSFGGALIFIVCFLFTATVSTLIVSLAYLAYRPLVALMYAALVGAIVAVSVFVIPAMKTKTL